MMLILLMTGLLMTGLHLHRNGGLCEDDLQADGLHHHHVRVVIAHVAVHDVRVVARVGLLL